MSVFLLGSGLVRQLESNGPVQIGPVRSSYKVAVPGLHREVARAERVLPVALALLKGCDRLAALDIEGPGGTGVAQAPDALP